MADKPKSPRKRAPKQAEMTEQLSVSVREVRESFESVTGAGLSGSNCV
jgi:hypothetical protein